MKFIDNAAGFKAILGMMCFVLINSSVTHAKNPAAPMKPEFYYLQVTALDCQVTCSLNGFPVYEINAEGELSNQIPVNLYLIGKKNELKIRIKPNTDGPGKVEASTYLYGASEIVSTDDAQGDREKFIVESMDGSKEATFYFDNDKFDFSAVISEGPVIDQESELKAYAAELLTILKKKDIKTLLSEMDPKVRDYAISFSAAEETLINSLKGQLTEILSHNKLKKPSIDDIIYVPYCGGRLWGLKIKPDLPFVYISEDDTVISLEIYVGTANGVLKIVR